ncbi:PREDICTED: interferon kappa [Miniopterus natalensis]|uniref:interferon kappa n=1 Tax=Miniopterus natalensis TaxID=291302 RepID=UPI0007A6C4F4|nr:PREDICTED: interferon kappa [Miniopterus natalensis]
MNTMPDVIRQRLWPACLVGLFFTGTLSLDCDLLHTHLRRVIWQNLRLLSSLSKSFPVECLRENEAFELPQELLSYTQPPKRDIRETFYEMSMLAFNILAQSTFQSTWEKNHLEQIQIGLDQQLQYLEQCLREEKETEDEGAKEEGDRKHPGMMMPQLSNLELRRYFYRIGSFLKGKKYSRCAWKIVRVEIRRCFYYFQKFIALLRKK